MDSAFGAMDNPEALITYGMAGEALSAIQGEIIKSKDIYHLLITSQILRATGDLDGALLSSRKALDIDPFNESHILNQVVNLAFNGDSMELEAYSKALSDRLHESSELQAYLRKIIAVHGILRETTFSSSSKEAGKSVQPYYVYADTNVVLKAPVRVGFNEMPRIKRNSAIYDPSTRCWYEYETGMLVGDLLQASWNAEGFAFGAVPRRQLSHQELNDLKAASIVVDGTATFMPVINHFGHFITQCSPYLSFLGWMDCGSVQSLIIDNSLPSYADELLAMHPSTQNMNIVNPGTSPVYCENLVYSSQMWHEWHYSSSNAFRFLEDVSSIILETSRIEPPARIYVSRSRVKAGLRASVNEEDLESRLKTKGFHAIHPQELTLKEVISLFSGADEIIGHAGSAMHNLIFSRRSSEQRIYYLAHELPAYNFHMIDCVKHILNPVYLRKGCAEIRSEPGTTPWLVFYPDFIMDSLF